MPKEPTPHACKSGSDSSPVNPDHIWVEFIEPDGNSRLVQVLIGQNLLDAALHAGVQGIQGQCGGAINCATCLCDIPADLTSCLPQQHRDELELLDWVDEASTNSRLCCQIIATKELCGLVLRVVPTVRCKP